MPDLEHQIARYALALGDTASEISPPPPEGTRRHLPLVPIVALTLVMLAGGITFALTRDDGDVQQNVAGPPASDPSPSGSDARPSEPGVPVRVTGVVLASGGEHEICPTDAACAGLRVLGDLTPSSTLQVIDGTMSPSGFVPIGSPQPAPTRSETVTPAPRSDIDAVRASLDSIDGVYLPSVSIGRTAAAVTVVSLYATDAAVTATIRASLPGETEVRAFIEVMSGTIDDLPPTTDDPLLDVQEAPVTGGALARLTVELAIDEERHCIYGIREGTGERVALRWPFGYRSTDDPVAVMNTDGTPVGQVGDILHLAGGEVRSGEHRCGASVTFVVNG